MAFRNVFTFICMAVALQSVHAANCTDDEQTTVDNVYSDLANSTACADLIADSDVASLDYCQNSDCLSELSDALDQLPDCTGEDEIDRKTGLQSIITYCSGVNEVLDQSASASGSAGSGSVVNGEAAECTTVDVVSASSTWAFATTSACKPYLTYMTATEPVHVYAPCTATDCVAAMEGVAKELPDCTFSSVKYLNNKSEVQNALAACNAGSIIESSSSQLGFSRSSSLSGSASATYTSCTTTEVKSMWYQYVSTAENAACAEDALYSTGVLSGVNIVAACSSSCADLIGKLSDSLPNCWYDYGKVNKKEDLVNRVNGCAGTSGSLSAAIILNAEDSTAVRNSGTSDPSGAVETTDNSRSSGSTTGIIIGIAVGVVLLVLVGGILFWRYRRNKTKQESQQIHAPGDLEEATTDHIYQQLATPQKIETASTTPPISDGVLPSKRWDHEAIIAARIPRDKVVIERLINRGGFGEVYAGSYNGLPVAIKMLLPERKKILREVDAFLSEVKLMSTLDHPRIVEFIGVAWNSLTDLCIVTEFMATDLKALLSEFASQGLPVGFDHDKVKIALHVAHALTYLHSCAPPVIHRDLKSSNILLNEQMEAKVTDFGISRERIDATMTAGVGTSLWMAPEVMLGERYDDKADMFSLGVLLSEIDQHALPYSHAKNNGNSGQRLTDAAILQMVAAGKLRVEFSQAAPESMVELAHACVSMDPKQRPTAAEALYRLQTILSHEM
ncbi:TKL/DRK protein kinase [Phytophthora megakarya]|uniref:TKL/DRK protein kinase n=1 Tax=Phytophthora megakarya TaxID=4795 RepID=A0A225V916_9STRA|nr:TKL/DRK protein kinase [Phytophthora megakarya]